MVARAGAEGTMGQQASRCLYPDNVSACALGRPGQDNELVTHFDVTRAHSDSCIQEICVHKTPPGGVLKGPQRDLPGGSKLERTVRRRLFDEDPALNLWVVKEGTSFSPLQHHGLGQVSAVREAFRPAPLALRLGFVSPDGNSSSPGQMSYVSPHKVQVNFSHAARVGGA